MRFGVLITLGFAAFLVMPGTALGQYLDPQQRQKSALVPILGHIFGYSHALEVIERDMAFEDEEDRSFKNADIGGGIVAGLLLMHRPIERLSLGATVLYSSLDWRFGAVSSTERLRQNAIDVTYRVEADKRLLIKGLATVHLPTPFPLSLTVGPGILRTVPRITLGVPAEVSDPMNHWAVGFGAETVFPLWGEHNLRIAFENNLIFWDTKEVASRIDALNMTNPPAGQEPRATRTTVLADPFSLPIFHLGFVMPF